MEEPKKTKAKKRDVTMAEIEAHLIAYVDVETWKRDSPPRRVRPQGYRSQLDDSDYQMAMLTLPKEVCLRAARVRTAIGNLQPMIPEAPALIMHWRNVGSVKTFKLDRGVIGSGGKKIGTAWGMLRLSPEDVVTIWWHKLLAQVKLAIEVSPVYRGVE